MFVKNKALIETIRAHLSDENNGIVCAYVFGSVARGEDQPTSDVDIAILYREEPVSTLQGLGFELAGKLERSLRRTVDLVILNQAPVDLIHRILRDGILIYETDASGRVQFETRARREYFDILPYLRQYRRLVSKV